jgi:hypothetical protein
VPIIVVREGLMWILTSMEEEEFVWEVVSWPIEGLLKWYFSTPIAITGLEEEGVPIFALECTMAERNTTWKGYSSMN